MLRRRFRAGWEQSGQTVIEMALGAPVFLLLLFGIFEYSIVLFSYCNATYACRNAARYASLHSSSSLAPSTTSQIQGVVTSGLYLPSAISPTISVTYLTPAMATGTNTVGNFVTVSTTWSQNVHLPFASAVGLSIATQDTQLISR
jgi:Flp pilus assembly protein TadG